MKELTLEEMQQVEGGSITAGAVVVGLCGFGVGAVVGFVVIAGIIYVAKNI